MNDNKVVEPDHMSVCDFVTFGGNTLQEALLKLANWVEQCVGELNGYVFDPELATYIDVSFNPEDEEFPFRISLQGDYTSDKSLKELNL